MNHIQKQYYHRKEMYPIKDILPLIDASKGDRKILLGGDMVRVSSLRLLTFKTVGCNCVKCGIEGQFFRKERAGNVQSYHLNLYAINSNGQEMLMTKDHIIPKSKGGKDTLSNLQTMCSLCNIEKDNNEYIDYRGKIPKSKKPLYYIIKDVFQMVLNKFEYIRNNTFTIKRKTKEQHYELWNNKNIIRRDLYKIFGI